MKSSGIYTDSESKKKRKAEGCINVFVHTSWKPLWGSSHTLQAAKCSAQLGRAPSPRIPALARCGRSEPQDLGQTRRHTECPSHPPGRSGKPDSAGVGPGVFHGPTWATTALCTLRFSRFPDPPRATPPRRYLTWRILTSRCPGWTHPRLAPAGAAYWECWSLHWGCWFSLAGNAGSYERPTPGSKSASPAANWFGPFLYSAAVPPIPPLHRGPVILPLTLSTPKKAGSKFELPFRLVKMCLSEKQVAVQPSSVLMSGRRQSKCDLREKQTAGKAAEIPHVPQYLGQKFKKKKKKRRKSKSRLKP